MKVEQWAIDKPIPYARNAREITDDAIDKVAASLKEFGFRQPIVVDKAGVVVAGHTRLLAAKKLGLKKVPVHVASNLTDAQVKSYRLADNRTAEETRWRDDLLGVELEELKGLDEWLLGVTGFDDPQIEEYLRDAQVPDFSPGTEDEQGNLDKLEPKIVRCPKCSHEFDSRGQDGQG